LEWNRIFEAYCCSKQLEGNREFLIYDNYSREFDDEELEALALNLFKGPLFAAEEGVESQLQRGSGVFPKPVTLRLDVNKPLDQRFERNRPR
jgi:hypothetical protein